MTRVKFILIFITFSGYSQESTIENDKELLKIKYINPISWFSSIDEVELQQTTYSNGQRFFRCEYGEDSLVESVKVYHLNGKVSFQSSLIFKSKEYWSKDSLNFYLRTRTESYSFYDDSNLRSYLIEGEKVYFATYYDQKGEPIFEERAVHGDTISGLYMSNFLKNGIIFTFIENKKVKYYIETNLLNEIVAIRKPKGRKIMRKSIELRLNTIMRLKGLITN